MRGGYYRPKERGKEERAEGAVPGRHSTREGRGFSRVSM